MVAGVGKSSLLLRFTEDNFEDLSPTIGEPPRRAERRRSVRRTERRRGERRNSNEREGVPTVGVHGTSQGSTSN